MSEPQFQQPIRRCHASPGHQRSHVTWKTFLFASAAYRSTSGCVPVQTPSNSREQREFFFRQCASTWRAPIGQTRLQKGFRPTTCRHVALSHPHTMQAHSYRRIRRRQISESSERRSNKVKEDTQMEDYLTDTSKECEVFQIEPEIVTALNEGEDEMKIDVNSDKPEKPQIESEENQPLVLVQLPTLPCTFGKPYKGVEVRERLHIFYNADTFVLDEPDMIDSFVLEVPNEFLNVKDGVHA
ncbi:hypothetical protein Syun_009750 [Stephania yunnanensis]|uniref:Uncharacterized protein n=1 Tax=Stephania yunnanensis TaxID=152371 RepID=A0AAP0KF42_9MAGN